MEESKRRKIEKKLREMLSSEEQTQHNNEQIKNVSCGARVIRRRNGLPDVVIA
jgi:hypothetical protein